MSAPTTTFEPHPASVGAARQYAVTALHTPEVRHLHDDVRTIVSELATNAVLHARTPFTLEVVVDGAEVRVAVSDASPTRPRLPRHGEQEATTGRGLRIVADLSNAWGVELTEVGKTTWCRLTLGSRNDGARHEHEHDRAQPRGPEPSVDLDELLARFGEDVQDRARTATSKAEPRGQVTRQGTRRGTGRVTHRGVAA